LEISIVEGNAKKILNCEIGEIVKAYKWKF
jgi:hypothetical protein